MAKKSEDKSCEGLCAGKLEAGPGDTKIRPTDTPESVMTQVALLCDDNTGVFFFRKNGNLYMRVVEAE